MAIWIDKIGSDDQKLPAVSWIEDRNLFAGGKRERISCYIRPDENTGELQFVAVGSVRHGKNIEARPWEKLISFELTSAEKLYRTAQEQVLLHAVGQKYAAARIAFSDGAFVLLAHFGDVPMHLNRADTTPAEAHELYGVLKREFIDKRLASLNEAGCRGDYVWPRQQRFKEFVPPELKPLPWWFPLLEWGVVVGVLGLLGAGFYWLISH